MKKSIVLMMALAACVAAHAADVSVTADFASAYVFRGATFNNGLVFQPGVEVSGFPIPEEYGSLAFGIWGNYDLDEVDGKSAMSEIDYYMSYSLPISVIDVSVGYCEYDYPQAGGQNDQELSVSFGSAIGESMYSGISVYYGLQGAIDEDIYIEGTLDYETALSDALTLSAGATVGYLITDGADDDGFHNASASVGLGYALTENWSASAGLTYITELDQAVFDGVDVEVVASVGVGCDF